VFVLALEIPGLIAQNIGDRICVGGNIHPAFNTVGTGNLTDYYQLGSWVIHVTVADVIPWVG
jgi:hypothetical protein